METKEMTCINCPMGCALTVTIDGDNVSVSGNTCPRGAAYGKTEVTNPTRTVTSSVKVVNGNRVSCKTQEPIPKGKIFDVMKEIKSARAKAPVKIGDVLISDVAGTGVNVVATKNII